MAPSHQVVDPSFLLLTTPLPFAHPSAHHTFFPFRGPRRLRQNAARKSGRFPRISRIERPARDCEHVDRRASSASSSMGNYPPPGWLSFPYNFPDFATPVPTCRVVYLNFANFPRDCSVTGSNDFPSAYKVVAASWKWRFNCSKRRLSVTIRKRSDNGVLSLGMVADNEASRGKVATLSVDI